MDAVANVLRVASVPAGVGIGFWTALLTKDGLCANHGNGALSVCPQFYPVANFAVWQCVLFGAAAAVVVLLLALALTRLPSTRAPKPF
jgi:hypothetical protein